MIRHAADPVRQHVAFGIALHRVAGHAFEVAAVRTHVHVELTRCIGNRHGEVAMFDVVAATGFGVAVDAIVNCWRAAIHGDALCNEVKVYRISRESCRRRRFGVGCRLVVANEAVDVFGIAEIVAGIFVVVASMALRATGFVCRDCDAEVVQNVVLTVDLVFKAFDIR